MENPSRTRSTARSKPTADAPPAASRIRSAAAVIAAWSSPHVRPCSAIASSSSPSIRTPHSRSTASCTLSRVERVDIRVGDRRSSRRRSRRRCSRCNHSASYSRRRASSIVTPSMRTGLRTKKPSRSYQVYSPRNPHSAAPPGPVMRNRDCSSSTYCSRAAAFRSRCASTRSMKRSSSLSSPSCAPAAPGPTATTSMSSAASPRRNPARHRGRRGRGSASRSIRIVIVTVSDAARVAKVRTRRRGWMHRRSLRHPALNPLGPVVSGIVPGAPPLVATGFGPLRMPRPCGSGIVHDAPPLVATGLIHEPTVPRTADNATHRHRRFRAAAATAC